MTLPIPAVTDLPRRRLTRIVQHRRWLVVGILLIAVNLRPVIVAMSPLLNDIRDSAGLSAGGAGVLTALPILCFGLMAPLAPRLAHRFGVEVALLVSLAALVIGAWMRLPSALVLLFAGTIVIGAAAAIGNVLLPAAVKEYFPRRTGLLLGLYSAALSGGAALAAGVSVPIERLGDFGWRPTLASWSIPIMVAIAVWVPVAMRSGRGPAPRPDGGTVRRRAIGLWRDATAWHVTLFFAWQSLIFYAVMMWLPSLLTDHGMSRGAAGWMLSIAAAVGIVSALVTPGLAAAHPRQVTVWVTVQCAVPLAGLLAWPVTLAPLWAALLGLGTGASLGLSLSLILARTNHPVTTAALAGMSQSVGYLAAALGPFLLGLLHDLTGGWTAALVVLLLLLIPQTFNGLRASRDRDVAATVT